MKLRVLILIADKVLNSSLSNFLQVNYPSATINSDIDKFAESLPEYDQSLLFIDIDYLLTHKEVIDKIKLSVSKADILTILIVESLAEYKCSAVNSTIFNLIISKHSIDNDLKNYLHSLNYLDNQNTELRLEDIVLLNTRHVRHKNVILNIINQTNDGLWMWDVRNNTVIFSDIFRSFLGYTSEQLPDSMESFLNLIHSNDREYFQQYLTNLTKTQGNRFDAEIRILCSDKSYHWFTYKGYIIKDTDGQALQVFGFQLCIHKFKDRIEMLEKMVLYDPLTKLPNKSLLYDRLEREIYNSSRNHKLFGLLFIDLNRFKAINDSFGHKIGDLVLIETAKRLQECVRKIDTVARLYGDEFIIIVPSLKSYDSLSTFIKRIETSFSQPVLIEDIHLSLTCSIGSSIYPRDGVTKDSLMEKADLSMYKRKHYYQTLTDSPDKNNR